MGVKSERDGFQAVVREEMDADLLREMTLFLCNVTHAQRDGRKLCITLEGRFGRGFRVHAQICAWTPLMHHAETATVVADHRERLAALAVQGVAAAND